MLSLANGVTYHKVLGAEFMNPHSHTQMNTIKRRIWLEPIGRPLKDWIPVQKSLVIVIGEPISDKSLRRDQRP